MATKKPIQQDVTARDFWIASLARLLNHATMLSLKIVKFYLYTVSMPVVFYCNFELTLVKKVKVLKSFSQLFK